MSQDESNFLSDQPTDQPIDPAAASDQAILIHLSLLFGIFIPLPFIGIIAPLIIWQTTKSNSPLLDKHGRNAMNWVISSTLYSVLLPLTVVGIILLPILAGLGLVFPIIASVKASKGEVWKYPLTFNVLGDRAEKMLQRATVALLSLCVFPLAALVGSGVWANRHGQWLTSLSKENGTVTEIVEELGSDGETLFKPVVSFKDQTGETYRVSPLWASNPPNYQQGDVVEVLYPQTEPTRAMINNWPNKWFVPAMALGGATLWLVFSVIPSLVCLIMSWFIPA